MKLSPFKQQNLAHPVMGAWGPIFQYLYEQMLTAPFLKTNFPLDKLCIGVFVCLFVKILVYVEAPAK